MEIILHRRNTIKLLNELPKQYGAEIDLRSYKEEIVIHHDPYEVGINFKDWLKHYKHGILILNLKEDGLEEKVLKYLRRYNIKSFFFLDQSMPSIIRNIQKGIPNCAIRVSEYEPIQVPLYLEGKINWVWLDIFTKFSLTNKEFKILKNAKYKICLVSPELQEYNNIEIYNLQKHIKKEEIFFDAVCTKFPDKWIDFY